MYLCIAGWRADRFATGGVGTDREYNLFGRKDHTARCLRKALPAAWSFCFVDDPDCHIVGSGQCLYLQAADTGPSASNERCCRAAATLADYYVCGRQLSWLSVVSNI